MIFPADDGIAPHRWAMIGIFSGALVLTGLFTLMPGRAVNAVLSGGWPVGCQNDARTPPKTLRPVPG